MVTSWFEMSVRPWHRGVYELLYLENRVLQGRFSKGTWHDTETKELIDTKLLLGWRGRIQQYPEKNVHEVVQAMESGHQRKYAIPLFRHWVSVQHFMKACRYFEIGKVLGAKFKVHDKRAYDRINRKLSSREKLKVEKSVDRFFGR